MAGADAQAMQVHLVEQCLLPEVQIECLLHRLLLLFRAQLSRSCSWASVPILTRLLKWPWPLAVGSDEAHRLKGCARKAGAAARHCLLFMAALPLVGDNAWGEHIRACAACSDHVSFSGAVHAVAVVAQLPKLRLAPAASGQRKFDSSHEKLEQAMRYVWFKPGTLGLPF